MVLRVSDLVPVRKQVALIKPVRLILGGRWGAKPRKSQDILGIRNEPIYSPKSIEATRKGDLFFI